MFKMEEIKNNENCKVCSECGGKCCKNISGSYHPDDFPHGSLTEEFIEDLCVNHKVTIDAYMTVYGMKCFLRPRVSTDKTIAEWSWGGTCIHLTPTGCSLKFEDRPFGCRLLDPETCGSSTGDRFDKEDAGNAWIRYNEVLQSIALKHDIQMGRALNKPDDKVVKEVAEWFRKYSDASPEIKKVFDNMPKDVDMEEVAKCFENYGVPRKRTNVRRRTKPERRHDKVKCHRLLERVYKRINAYHCFVNHDKEFDDDFIKQFNSNRTKDHKHSANLVIKDIKSEINNAYNMAIEHGYAGSGLYKVTLFTMAHMCKSAYASYRHSAKIATHMGSELFEKEIGVIAGGLHAYSFMYTLFSELLLSYRDDYKAITIREERK